MRKCNQCGLEKPDEEMTKSSKTGLPAPLCKSCKNENKKLRNKLKKDGKFLSKNGPLFREQDFKRRAEEVHQGTYLYDRVKYKGCKEKVEIFCTKHGDYFWQIADSHLQGNGCFDCGIQSMASQRRLTTEEFITKAVEIHGDKYDYSKVVYIHGSIPVIITCKEHGDFELSPTRHLSNEHGCPKCAKNGYNIYKPGKVYVLQNSLGTITKVGITNFDPKDRAEHISRNREDKFSVVKVYEFEDGRLANQIETAVLRQLRESFENPLEQFNGWTECFVGLTPEHAVSLIETVTEELIETA
jgi:hypothetical protein